MKEELTIQQKDLIRTRSRKPLLVVPFSSRQRIFAWIKDRFRVSRRREFWLITICMAAVVILCSGNLLGLFVTTPIILGFMICRSFMGPDNPFEQSLGLLTNVSGKFLVYQDWLTRHSPIDHAFGAIGMTALKIGNSATPEMNLVLGLICTIILLLLFLRLTRTPALLGLSERGISLIYKMQFLSMALPTIPWQEIKIISLASKKDGSSLDGVLQFSCLHLPLLYKLSSQITFATWLEQAHSSRPGLTSLSLDLKNLDNIKQRHQLARKLEELAEPESIEPDVLDNLTSTRSAGYTELWMQALSSPSSRQSMEPLTPGTKLAESRYSILGQIGVGGQGTAYFAECAQEGSQSTVVLKEFVLPLYVDVNSRKAALSRFLDEAEVLKNLDHPGVVKLVECFVEDHRGYVVLERVPGKSLRDLVESTGAMSESKALSILDQTLEILDYLHGRQPPVVHRDVAPDNLILDENGIVKLIDFNVAQQTDSTVLGTIVGKQAYVPPEQLRGMATVASDIYALGATIHFLLTGQDPEPLSQSHPRSIAEHISEATDDLVAKCTALNELERFQSIEEIHTARTEDPVGAKLKLNPEKQKLQNSG